MLKFHISTWHDFPEGVCCLRTHLGHTPTRSFAEVRLLHGLVGIEVAVTTSYHVFSGDMAPSKRQGTGFLCSVCMRGCMLSPISAWYADDVMYMQLVLARNADMVMCVVNSCARLADQQVLTW